MQTSPDDWNHILTLMAAIILADDIVLKNEIQSFEKNVGLLADELNFPLDKSNDVISRWFEARREDIAHALSGPHPDRFIMENIIALDNFPLKQTLLKGLIEISASDAEIHRNEADVINLAAVYWGLDIVKTRRAHRPSKTRFTK